MPHPRFIALVSCLLLVVVGRAGSARADIHAQQDSTSVPTFEITAELADSEAAIEIAVSIHNRSSAAIYSGYPCSFRLEGLEETEWIHVYRKDCSRARYAADVIEPGEIALRIMSLSLEFEPHSSRYRDGSVVEDQIENLDHLMLIFA